LSRDVTFKSQIQTLQAEILPINHGSGLNRTGRFNTSAEGIRIQTRDQIQEKITDSQYQEYKNFWTLIKIFEDPKEISNKNIEAYSSTFTTPAKVITPGYIKPRTETLEEGQEEIVKIDISDYYYINRELYSMKNQSNLMRVLC
jgi:hypothetical protein